MNDNLFLTLIGALTIGALFLGHPVALTFGGLGIIMVLIFIGPATLPIAVTKTYSIMVSFPLMAIPLFIFMAYILEKSGIAEIMFDGIRDLTANLPGGLAIAVNIVCTVFAASTGIIGASIVSMGVLAGPYLLEHGYDKKLTVGTIMAGGTLGIIIPPSLLLIVMGAVAGISVGKLFIGAIGPGLLLSLLYMIYIYVVCRRNPKLGPPVPKEEIKPLRTRLVKGITSVTPPAILMFVVLGSIFFGIATPSEAGAIGAFSAVILSICYGKFNMRNLYYATTATVKTSCMVLFIIVGVNIFSAVFMAMGCGRTLGTLFIGLGNKWLFFAMTMILIYLMGMIIDWTAILMLLIPIFFPIAQRIYGLDPFWFGMLVAVNLQVSFLSPPFGYALFFMKSLRLPGVTLGDVYKSSIPFIGLQIAALILIALFPQIVNFLTDLTFGV
jgi:tripartite ATP-independent transporter DctM subunit